MHRRDFVQHGATLAGGAALLSLTPAETYASTAQRNELDFAPEIAALRSRRGGAPPPITEGERVPPGEQGQRPLKQLGQSAVLLVASAKLKLFSGMDWGRRDRLF